MSYDIIGDVHGHHDKLEALLKTLGYRERNGAWRHHERSVIFVGDLIDRGPDQLATLKLARAMVSGGSARVVMGNHEFNAIAFATLYPGGHGEFCRTHEGREGLKNREQHEKFLAAVGEGSASHKEWIRWFLDLPLWIEEPRLRVIHACWSPYDVAALRPHLGAGERLGLEVVVRGSRKGGELYSAIETLLKGVEVKLPDGYTFKDKGGHTRHEIRTKWWDPTLSTYRAAFLGPHDANIPDLPMPQKDQISRSDRPIFIGHYWLPANAKLEPVSPVVACVDYSVANLGPLVAYRFDGESELTADKFVAVGREL